MSAGKWAEAKLNLARKVAVHLPKGSVAIRLIRSSSFNGTELIGNSMKPTTVTAKAEDKLNKQMNNLHLPRSPFPRLLDMMHVKSRVYTASK